MSLYTRFMRAGRDLSIVLGVLFLVMACSDSESAAGLYAVEHNGKIGYMDAKGRVVIDGAYDRASAFSEEDRAVVQVGDLYGIIDRSGAWVLEPKYETIGTFSEGLAPFYEDGQWGFLDSQGSVAIPARYRRSESDTTESFVSRAAGAPGPFVGGLAPAGSETGVGFIDTTGAWVVEPVYGAAGPFTDDGLAWASSPGWGLVDASGTEIIKPIYHELSLREDGYIQIERWGRVGLVEPDGRVLLQPRFEEIALFHNGHARVRGDDGWGLIDASGGIVIPAQYPELSNVQEDRIAFFNGDAAGFLDMENNVAIPAEFSAVYDFSCGRAAVRVGEQYGFVDLNGELVIEPVYDRVHSFTWDYAVVAKSTSSRSSLASDDWGVIDRSGNALLELSYMQLLAIDETTVRENLGAGVANNRYLDLTGSPVAEPPDPLDFNEAGIALEVIFNTRTLERRYVVHHESGEQLELDLPPGIRYVSEFVDDMAVIKDPGSGWSQRRGYMNARGEVVVPPVYEVATDFYGDYAYVRLSREEDGTPPWSGYIDKAGRQVVAAYARPGEGMRLLEYGLYPFETDAGIGIGKIDGDVVIDAGLRSIERVAHGMVEVVHDDGMMAVLRLPELSSLTAGYSRARIITESLLAVGHFRDHVVYIDRDGSEVFSAEEGFLRDSFREGFARLDSRQGYIDTTGERAVVFEDRHDYVGVFSHGRAVIENRADKWGFIDASGQVVVDFLFDGALSYSDNGLAAVKADGMWGFIDADGAWVIEPSFDAVGRFEAGLAPAAFGSTTGYINASGEWVYRSTDDSES